MKTLTPLECPSITQQLGEAEQMKIIQSAQVAKAGDGNVTVNMQQNPQVHFHIDAGSMRETLKLWLQTLPEPRWNYAKNQVVGLALEICGGNQELAGRFLGRSKRIVTYSVRQK